MAKTLSSTLLEAIRTKDYQRANHAFVKVMEAKLTSRLNEEKQTLVTEGTGYKCQECGKTYSKPVDECTKCGGSDIDLNESVKLTESKFKIYYADGSEEDFTGSAADVRAKVKKSTKEVDDVETIG